jgi:hypothetical protein
MAKSKTKFVSETAALLRLQRSATGLLIRRAHSAVQAKTLGGNIFAVQIIPNESATLIAAANSYGQLARRLGLLAPGECIASDG